MPSPPSPVIAVDDFGVLEEGDERFELAVPSPST